MPRQVSKWRMMARGLTETLEARGTWAAARRSELGLGPSEIEGLEVLRPEVCGFCCSTARSLFFPLFEFVVAGYVAIHAGAVHRYTL